MRKILLGLPALALFAASAPAFAGGTEPIEGITISGGITGVTDYRFRGVSLTDKDLAIQPTLTISHKSGFYVGTWMSNLKDSYTYGSWETDLYAGWTGEVGAGITVDAAVLYYTYLDGRGDSDYFEPYVSASYTIGPVTAKAGVNWAISSNATGNEDWFYSYGQLSAAIPSTPITVTGKFGHQELGNYAHSYSDWSLGASATFGVITAGVTYSGTNIKGIRPYAEPRLADDAVVFSLGVAF
ncbi:MULTISPECIES: TorF family putative porin [Sphingomonas]|uniref:Uncharacterized protein n=1 Tax=Edaphosphingomonas fennica TaxID=114404 RepID=A0A2T4HT64_9SPHN|nr:MULTISPECIES: TorF family putative porin [Sphingomonas]AGH49681.1 hypothetical protein G432_09780 [Sphingomonas sp. MM-1]MDX3884143.1 TorF family putative porin [Sphingomonas sp.]PTD18991.1 hypothetical protein CV103_14140 [Sphingomonas fennica]